MAGDGPGKPGRGNSTTTGASSTAHFGGGSCRNAEYVSVVTLCIGNDARWKAAAPAGCFGIAGHARDRVDGFETLGCTDGRIRDTRSSQKVRRRRSCWCRRFASAGLRAGGSGFGRNSNRAREASADSRCQQGRWVRAQSRREAQGSNGRARRGNAAGEQRTRGRETPEVGAPFEERENLGHPAGRKTANHERGRAFGERASDGSVTVSN